jgi:hypothetical protein
VFIKYWTALHNLADQQTLGSCADALLSVATGSRNMLLLFRLLCVWRMLNNMIAMLVMLMMLEGEQTVSRGLDHSIDDPRYWLVHVLVQLIVGILPLVVALCVVYDHSCT